MAGHDYDGAEKGSETETNARREIKRQLTQGLSPDAQLKTHVHQEKVSDNAFFSQSELNERRSDRMSATVAQRKGRSTSRCCARAARRARWTRRSWATCASRCHTGLSAFGYVRYREWVNAEDTSGRKRGRVAVSSETKPAARLDPGEGAGRTWTSTRCSSSPRRSSATSSRSSRRCNLVSSLLRSKPMERVGCLSGGPADIRKHVFFQKDDFDWGKLLRLELPPPYVPKIKSETDVSNFDRIESKVDFFAGEPYDFSDARQWDVDF